MNIVKHVTTALTIGCSIYAGIKMYRKMNMQKASALDPNNQYKNDILRNTSDNYDETTVNII